MEEKKNPVLSILSMTAFAVIIISWIYLRYSFYMVTAEIKELLSQCERFLDGMSETAVFLSPIPAGTIEAYSAVFDVTGISGKIVMMAVILLEALAGVLIFILSRSLLGVFYAFFCIVVMSLLPFFGTPVKVNEELSVLCLLLFEIMISLTWKYEKLRADEGPFVMRYLFVGVTAGLAVFLMPLNAVLEGISLLVSLYFLAGKRKFKLLLEYLIAIFSAAAVFFLLITVRVMNTALSPLKILEGYRVHFLDFSGAQYIFTALLSLLLYVLSVIIDMLPGSKAAEKKAVEAVKKEGDKRPVSLGGLPKDFVLHRAGDKKDIISSVETENAEEKKAEEIKAEEPADAEGKALKKDDKALKKADKAAKKDDKGVKKSEETVNKNEKTLLKSVGPVRHIFMPSGTESDAEKEQRINAHRAYAETVSPKDLEFDFEIPDDDDFDIEVKF